MPPRLDFFSPFREEEDITKGLVRNDPSDYRVKTDWGVELWAVSINKCIWKCYESETMTVVGMKFARDDAEVWDRSQRNDTRVHVKGSASSANQHGCSNPQYRFSSDRVVKTYEYAWFKIPEYAIVVDDISSMEE